MTVDVEINTVSAIRAAGQETVADFSLPSLDEQTFTVSSPFTVEYDIHLPPVGRKETAAALVTDQGQEPVDPSIYQDLSRPDVPVKQILPLEGQLFAVVTGSPEPGRLNALTVWAPPDHEEIDALAV